jgi:hypothetical protein
MGVEANAILYACRARCPTRGGDLRDRRRVVHAPDRRLRRHPPCGVRRSRPYLRCAASYSATIALGMRPRELRSGWPWPLAHSRMVCRRSPSVAGAASDADFAGRAALREAPTTSDGARVAGVDPVRGEERRFLRCQTATGLQPTPASGGLGGRPGIETAGRGCSSPATRWGPRDGSATPPWPADRRPVWPPRPGPPAGPRRARSTSMSADADTGGARRDLRP